MPGSTVASLENLEALLGTPVEIGRTPEGKTRVSIALPDPTNAESLSGESESRTAA